MKRATLADVARRAGLSTTAASLILNGRAGTGLSVVAHERVHTAARELGYRPNMMARSLRMERSASIGFISDFVASTRYASPLIRGALRAARDLDHTVLVVETEGDQIAQERAFEALLDRQVDAIILAAATGLATPPAVPLAVPVVLLNSPSVDGSLPAIVPDELQGGAAAASHLVERGFRTVHVLGAPKDLVAPADATVQVHRRLQGIRETLAAAGVEAVAVPVAGLRWDPEQGYEATRVLLEDGGEARALLCLNDPLAFGAYQAIAEAGLRIPSDVSIVSFDDDDLVSYLRPRLTTMALPFEAMGRRAVELALDGTAVTAEHREPMMLQVRGSTIAPPRA